MIAFEHCYRINRTLVKNVEPHFDFYCSIASWLKMVNHTLIFIFQAHPG